MLATYKNTSQLAQTEKFQPSSHATCGLGRLKNNKKSLKTIVNKKKAKFKNKKTMEYPG